LGTVTPFAGSIVSVTGLELTGFVGTSSFVISVTVQPEGVEARASAKKLVVWGPIIPPTTATWTSIAA